MIATKDALDLLQADHRELQGLVDSFGQLCQRQTSDLEKTAMAQAICMYLSIHTQVEAELFYPALRHAGGAAVFPGQPGAEHLTNDLIAQISVMQATDPLYDARVAVLGSAIAHHVLHQEREIFPMARKSRIDLQALGARMRARKSALLAEYAEMAGGAGRFDEAQDPVGPTTPAPLGNPGRLSIGASA